MTTYNIPGAVTVTEYRRPYGIRVNQMLLVGEDYAEKAKTVVLSAERLPDGRVVCYARRKGASPDDELLEMAENNVKSVVTVMCGLIDKAVGV